MSEGIEIVFKVDNVNKILEDVAAATETALKQCGEVIEGYAKEDCPVDTGNLRNSLTYRLEDEGGSVPALKVGSNVEYAPYVEFIDRYSHNVGKAHFLRDAGMDHFAELKDKTEKIFMALT